MRHHYVYATQAIIAYFGIWNLDFFRLLYTPLCLHPNTTTLQVLSLDYIIAVYPLLLIIFIYTLVRLHYKDLWCGCGGPSSAALLAVEGNGTSRTHFWMPLQHSSSSPMSSFSTSLVIFSRYHMCGMCEVDHSTPYCTMMILWNTSANTMFPLPFWLSLF